MNKFWIFVLLGAFSVQTKAQTARKVLFLGNSYTYFNNLPQTTARVAASAGDTLVFDSQTPGGYRLSDHCKDSVSLAKIAQTGWDFVILQEQSQLPAFTDLQVEKECAPFAEALTKYAKTMNPLVNVVFYQTWGRKFGDIANCNTFPLLCTYAEMDSLLQVRYTHLAVENEAMLAPVGTVWRHLRKHFPTIELYQRDNSHPTKAGTYAAACTFYTLFFEKNPNKVSYFGDLPPETAAIIRTVVEEIVYKNLADWKAKTPQPLVPMLPAIASDLPPEPIKNDSIHWVLTLPNAARDSITLDFQPEITSIEIVDEAGNYTVLEFDERKKSFYIGALDPGVYFVIINKMAFAKFAKP